MTPQISIRPAVADDLPFVVDLLGQLSLPADDLSFDEMVFVVAEIDGLRSDAQDWRLPRTMVCFAPLA